MSCCPFFQGSVVCGFLFIASMRLEFRFLWLRIVTMSVFRSMSRSWALSAASWRLNLQLHLLDNVFGSFRVIIKILFQKDTLLCTTLVNVEAYDALRWRWCSIRGSVRYMRQPFMGHSGHVGHRSHELIDIATNG